MRTFMVLLALTLFTTTLVGCKAEGEIGDDVRTSVPAVR